MGKLNTSETSETEGSDDKQTTEAEDERVHEEEKSWGWKRLLASITVEPVLFLMMFANGMTQVVTQDLVIALTCTVNLNYTEKVCVDLTNDTVEDAEVAVSLYSSRILMLTFVLWELFSIPACLFLGSWTDRHGRKPAMIASLLGNVLCYLLFILISTQPLWPAEVTILPPLLYAFPGGYFSFYMATLSYASDKSGNRSRTTRILFVVSVRSAAEPLGVLFGNLMYQIGSFLLVYTSCSAILTVALLYLIRLVPESHRGSVPEPREGSVPEPREGRVPESGRGGERVGRCWSVVDTFSTLFRKEEGKRRDHFVLLSAALVFSISPYNGRYTLEYLFTRKVLLWKEESYTLFSAFNDVAPIIGGLLMMPLLSYHYQVRDIYLGLAGAFSAFVQFLLLGMVTSPDMWWLFYLWCKPWERILWMTFASLESAPGTCNT